MRSRDTRRAPSRLCVGNIWRQRHSESVTRVAARLYIGVHARADVIAAWVGVVTVGHVLLQRTRAAAAAWLLPAFTRLVELMSCCMAESI